MKKVLLASTALVLSAGVAAADVTVSGDGRMGILYSEAGYANAITGADKDYSFTSRIRIKFTASGETDGGLAFGGDVRLDQQDSTCSASSSVVDGEFDANGNPLIDTSTSCRDTGGSTGTAGKVFISGEFGKLSMGDVDGGAEVAVGDLLYTSLTGLGDQNENLYLFGGNDPSALYEYSNGGLLLALGISDDEEFSAGVGYDGGMWSVGLGYEKVPEGSTLQITIDDQDYAFGTANSTIDQLIAGASVTFADITFKGTYGIFDAKDGGDLEQYGVSAEGTWGATTVAAYWRQLNAEDNDRDIDATLDAYGIGAEYDLGGGAAVAGGVASIDDNTVADLGVKFAF